MSVTGNCLDTYIVDQFKAALHQLKDCMTEAQRFEYGLLLRAVAPPLLRRGDTRGMVNNVAARLEVPYGMRWQKTTKKPVPYAFTRAVQGRAQFELARVEANKPKEELHVGDAVLSRGQVGVLTAVDQQTEECTVTFSVEGAGEKTVRYSSMFGNTAGSARLQRVPPQLAPPRRHDRKDKISEEVLEHVAHVYETNCPTSPHQRDRQRRLLASHVWEEKQAMIPTEALQNLFNIFVKEYPDDKLSFTKFKSLREVSVTTCTNASRPMRSMH